MRYAAADMSDGLSNIFQFCILIIDGLILRRTRSYVPKTKHIATTKCGKQRLVVNSVAAVSCNYDVSAVLKHIVVCDVVAR